MLDTSDLMADAAAALIDDSFFRCFTSAPPDPWNWNWYLFPVWCLGVAARYCLLFPLRLLLLLATQALFLAVFMPLQVVLAVRSSAAARSPALPLPPRLRRLCASERSA